MENNYAENLRRETLAELNVSTREFSKNSHQQETEANKLLFTLSTFVIPLSLVAISSDKISQNINYLDKHLIFLSWIFLMASAILGIVRFQKSTKYFDRWAAQENKRANCFTKIIANNSYDDYFEMIKESNKLIKMPNNEAKTVLIFQYISSSIGMGLIFFVLSKFLFNL